MPEITPALLLLVFALTVLAALLTTRLSIFLSHCLGILDMPSARKAHRQPVAYLGGLGMLLAFLIGALLLSLFVPAFCLLHRDILVRVIIGAVAIFLVGFFDDVRPIPPLLKLFLQCAVAFGMWWAGVRIDLLSFLPFARETINPVLSAGITIGWYVALMNSINLVDGLDGLAGGISLIGALSLVGVFLVVIPSPQVLVASGLAAVVAGSVMGFLFFNWHPARTFMGDGGSLLLGFLLATVSLIGSAKTSTLLAMAVPLVALGLPLFETFFSFLRRALKGQHPFRADRRHLHHRLLDVGLDQRRVVVALLFMTAFLGINSVILAKAESRIVFFNVILLLVGLMILIENLHFLEKRRITDAQGKKND